MSNIKKEIVNKVAECVRRLRSPEKYKSLEFLCDYLGSEVYMNEKAQSVKHMIVTQVCTWNSSDFSKNNICLLYINSVYGYDDAGIMEILKRAKEKGAKVFITDKSFDNVPCVISNNPLQTYAKLCRYYRDLSKVSVTAVSGSIGKTTVKNMIAAVYNTKFKTTYTKANQNAKSEVGFAVQHIPTGAEKMIQEVHEGEPGESQYMSLMLNSEVYVMTTIDKSHLKFFETPDRIIEEVCSFTKNMPLDGKVIVNTDEFNRCDLLNGRMVIKVSTLDANADFFAENVNIDESGLSFFVNVKQNGGRFLVRLNNIYAIHNVQCALLAFAAGFCEGIEPEKIVKGLSEYKTEGVRQNIMRSKDGVVIYADCYNAIARSMKSAIDACDLIPVKGKRIAVLGDVEEVGEMSEAMHKEIIEFVNSSKFDQLMLVGEKMKKALGASSVRDSLEVSWDASIDELAKRVKDKSKTGDLVLFKASHSGNLDKCIVKIWPELRYECEKNILEAYCEWKTNCRFY